MIAPLPVHSASISLILDLWLYDPDIRAYLPLLNIYNVPDTVPIILYILTLLLLTLYEVGTITNPNSLQKGKLRHNRFKLFKWQS